MGGKIQDLTGQKFGMLTVVALDGVRNKRAHWKCRCECGVEKVALAANIKRGASRSCGTGLCHKSVRGDNIIGQSFGLLTVKSYHHKKNNKWYVECECACGSTCVATAVRLRKGDTKSCGCLNKTKDPDAIAKSGDARKKYKHIGIKTGRGNKSSIYASWQFYKITRILHPAWNEFINFYNDVQVPGLGIPDGYRLHRIDTSRPYEPGNVVWKAKGKPRLFPGTVSISEEDPF